MVVEVRLRGGGGRDRAKQAARADRGVVGSGGRGEEIKSYGFALGRSAFACNRGRICISGRDSWTRS